MSILGFLKEIFFSRTEKSGNEHCVYCRTENGKEIICKKVVKILIFVGILKL
jgi:hypothetical protein